MPLSIGNTYHIGYELKIGTINPEGGGRGLTPIYGLYGDVPLDKV